MTSGLWSPVEIRAARDGERVFAGQIQIARTARFVVVGVPDLDGAQARGGQARDQFFLSGRTTLVQAPGVRQRGDAAGGDDAADALFRFGVFAFNVGRATLAEVQIESLRERGDIAFVAQQAGKVRAPGDVAAERFGLFDGDRHAQFSELLGDAAIALVARAAQGFQPGAEVGAGFLKEVAEDVDAAAAGVRFSAEARA